MTNPSPTRSKMSARRKLSCAAMTAALSLLAPAMCARAQALPAAEASPISTGFRVPELGGSLRWGVSASESLNWGYYTNSGTSYNTGVSGDVAYLSSSTYRPFSMVLSAGRSWGAKGAPTYQFASLGLSQVFNLKRWNFVLSDSVSYLPSTATSGLSGVAGVGDLGATPPGTTSGPPQVGPDTGQGILVNYSPEVTNSGAASAQRQITGKTSLIASGSYSILRFLDGPGASGGFGLEDDSVTGSAGFNHRLDARNTFGANYAYPSYIFLNNLTNGVPEPNFVSQTASFTYSRQVSRKLDFNIAAGPQWTLINLSQNPPSLSAYADASVDYSTEFSRLSLSYVRGTNGGSGVVGGSLSDSASFVATHTFARVWGTAASVAWTHTQSLPTPNAAQYDLQTVVGGFQVSRALARSLSAYASFTAEEQTHTSTAGTVDLFNGLNQILGFGITYSPAATRIGR